MTTQLMLSVVYSRHSDEPLGLVYSLLEAQCTVLLPVTLYASQESVVFVPTTYNAGCSDNYEVYLNIMQNCDI